MRPVLFDMQNTAAFRHGATGISNLAQALLHGLFSHLTVKYACSPEHFVPLSRTHSTCNLLCVYVCVNELSLD